MKIERERACVREIARVRARESAHAHEREVHILEH
jgi:hypothetical protein